MHPFSVWTRAYHIIRRDYAKFEVDPATQLAYHRKMVRFWMLNFLPMNMLVSIDIWSILTSHNKLAAIMSAVLLAVNTNYSLYANWDTETGDAHAAYAGVKADQIQDTTRNADTNVGIKVEVDW